MPVRDGGIRAGVGEEVLARFRDSGALRETVGAEAVTTSGADSPAGSALDLPRLLVWG